MKTINVNGEEYVAKKDAEKALKARKVAPTKIQIVVLQRGWVAIGRFSQKGEQCHLTNASVVRRWGTENGLGELAEKGPIPNGTGNGPTTLDKCPDLHFHEMTVVCRMDVNEAVWGELV
jgi:hypothetical protein